MVIYEKTERRLIIPTGRDIPLDIVLPTSGDCAEAIAEARLQGYNSGISDGKAAQMAIDNAKLTPAINIIQNGEYVADYGYKKVVVDVPTSGDCSEAIAIAYQSGYTAGQADCPDCPPCPPCDCTEAYQSGITAGVAQQKALLASTAFTENGTYTRENGWNSVQVNVSHQNIYYPIVISGTFVISQDVTIDYGGAWLGYDYVDNITQTGTGFDKLENHIFIDGIMAADISAQIVIGEPLTFSAGTHTYKMECNGAWIANAPYETYNSLSNFQFGTLQPSGVNIKLFINKEQ